MSVAFDARCMVCHLRRYVDAAYSLGNAETANVFAKELLKLYLAMPEDASSVTLGPAVEALVRRLYGVEGDRFREEKRVSNEFVLRRLPLIREKVASAPDRLLAALQFAVLGNYIDFSALHGEVSFDTLSDMLEQAQKITLDDDCFASLKRDLAVSARLVYLTDNAGEIGFDRIFAETIHALYPHLQITFCVRGAPILNDATREDALFMEIPFPIIDNGIAIAGTDLSSVSEQARGALEHADVIIAKGQGNAETLLGCGLNVYYVFLAKCERFTQRFHVPKLTPMLVRERGNAK